LLSFAEIACLTVGLLVFYGLARSGVEREAARKSRGSLEGEAEPLLDRLCRAGGLDRGSKPTALGAIRREFGALSGPADAVWLVADSEWTVVALLGAPPSEGSAGPAAGERLVWSSLSGEEGEPGMQSGVLICDGRKRVAAARPLEGREGYVVAHRALGEVEMPLTALTDSLAGAGFVAWAWTSGLLAFVTYLVFSKNRQNHRRVRAEAEAQTLRQIQALVRTRDALIFGLASMAESRDEVTGRHVERVSFYASRLAMAAGGWPRFRDEITSEFVRHIAVSSVLHDIGKVGIEDAILFKPGRLTDAERRRMQEHTAIGGRYLAQIEQRLGRSPVIHMARDIALRHHERWDGSGYPDGLVGEAIPLAARIVAIADVYEALTSLRTYKPPYAHERCVEMIREGAGKQFDPELVEAFMTVEASFRQIIHQYGEHVFQGEERTAVGKEPVECVGLVAAMAALDDSWTIPAPSSPGG
jgi:HD-GYP domain-containing protein (c-di-GMP phosphodiesterase class II)